MEASPRSAFLPGALKRAPYVVFVGHAFRGAVPKNPLDGRELWRTLAMARGPGDRCVLELDPGKDTAEHETAAAHVAPTDKRRRKDETVAEDRLQDLDVLPGSDAPQQDDIAVRADRVKQRTRPTLERLAILSICEIDGHGSKRFERRERDRCVSGAQTCVGRNHQHAASHHRIGGVGRAREPSRVGKLAAEVQAADEAEDVAERRSSGRPQLPRKRELRDRRHDHARADAATIRR